MSEFIMTAVVNLTKFKKVDNKTARGDDGKSIAEASWKGTVTFVFPGDYTLEDFAKDSISNTTQSPVVKYASVYRPQLTADGSFIPPSRIKVNELYKQKAQADPISIIVNSSSNAFILGIKARMANETNPATLSAMQAMIDTMNA